MDNNKKIMANLYEVVGCVDCSYADSEAMKKSQSCCKCPEQVILDAEGFCSCWSNFLGSNNIIEGAKNA